MKHVLFATFLLSSPSYAFICELGACTQQCTSPDSVIGDQPLPVAPDINHGNYVDCMYACIDLKEQLFCSDGSTPPRIEGSGNNLDRGDNATVPIFEKGTFKAYAEPGFTPQDRTLLKEAFEIAFEQLGALFLTDPINSEFGKCTNPTQYEVFAVADMWGVNFWDKNTYGFGSIWREPRILDQRRIRDSPRIKYEVRVVKTWESDALGSARIGNHSVARPVIALNWNFMKGYRLWKGSWIKDPIYTHPGFWASTIVHELLHTVGYTHPEGFDWNDPQAVEAYKKNFMVNFSDCIEKVTMPETFNPNSTLFMRE
ncbi:hypothetical protein [Oligoflexus tunisiensis]|uniref:hypothetical protein n=1 Tax=Oligoflexus tunisiensis TaxID=708132 RepID=UPI00114CF640|nr:hypothetical protein [Oligoflexus tunisiensis]